ncbi:MAG: hypothetical protein QOE58_3628 [Actinomycetota bacterium]|nr:hypothetical protein [Actinomycetota bacterium]
MGDLEQQWRRKGATLSDKTARKEYGLSQDEIDEAIRVGKLQYRVGLVHGNPWLRLLRGEVEEVVRVSHGQGRLEDRLATTELALVDSELRRLRMELTKLEEQRAELAARLARGHDGLGMT